MAMDYPWFDYNYIELQNKNFVSQAACMYYSGNYNCDQTDPDFLYNPYVFSNEMDLSVAANVPPTIVYSTEFDMFRHFAEEACDLYAEAGTLLDCGFEQGTIHMNYIFTDIPVTDQWYNSMKLIVDAYLH
jgi:acetyl esterase/lipase